MTDVGKQKDVQKNWGDTVKWLVVVISIAVAVWGNSYYSELSILYRVPALSIVAIIAAYIAYYTVKGRAFWDLVQGARAEIRRVVWPTQQETSTTTLIVVAFTVAMGLILWGLDTFFGWLVSFFIG